jgi:predicted AAA+ superfamily ATPase
MRRREQQALLRERLRAAPAVLMTGPRQSGKTTLARSLSQTYFDLEQEADRLRLDLEWERLVRGRSLVVLDEAQAHPPVFARVRGAIDAARRRHGRFLLTGSVSPLLMREVSESLAGRLALLELTPLLRGDLDERMRRRHWLTGGFPDGGVLRPRAFPRWQLDYLDLLVQRDLPNWGLPAAPAVAQRLLRMIAAVHGQIWNASQIGQAMGLSYHTVNRYLDFLEGAFLVRRLAPWSRNVGKRLVKSPRVYVRDSGLLHALLRIGDQRVLLEQPWVGASFEGYVIEQALGTAGARGLRPEPNFFRTSDGHELDLLLDWGSERWAVEVKLTTAPAPSDMARLDRAADLVGATRRFLVSRVSEGAASGRRVSCDVDGLLAALRAHARA